jgi:hypothetical protein
MHLSSLYMAFFYLCYKIICVFYFMIEFSHARVTPAWLLVHVSLDSKGDSILIPFRSPGVGHIKIDTRGAYMLYFECSTYA